MRIINRTLFNMLVIISCSMPISALAGSLTLVNNTDYDSTTITNDFMCSDHLPGGKGVTKANSTNIIPENTVNVACIKNKTNCKADVYLTNNCSGPKIATVIFDVKSGIKSVTMIENKYVISGSGFYITLCDPTNHHCN